MSGIFVLITFSDIIMENKKKLKAQLTNEIAKQYSSRIKELENSRNALRTKIEIERQNFRELQHKYLEMCQKLESLEDWNRRLMEFIDMDEDTRNKYIKHIKTQEKFDETLEKLTKMTSMFLIYEKYSDNQYRRI